MCVKRSLLIALLLGCVAPEVTFGPIQTSNAARMHDNAPVGTELWHLDTVNGHYTQAPYGLTRLQLFNSPVGIPGPGGWHLRDTTLGAPAADGTVAPANLPFSLHIATNSAASTLASLVNEDGVSLGIGLASVSGAAPAGVTGQVGDSAVTFTAPVAASPSDVAVRATISGVDLRVTVHSASEAGPIVFSLLPDMRAQVAQDASGVIRVTRAITVYDDTGSPGVMIQPEYLIASPIAVDSGTDPATPVSTGPASIALVPGSTGQQNLAISIDPAWLHDAHRTFPVRLDVPIATVYSAVHTGWLGTVNSCAPAAQAAQTDVIVGVEGACTYHGLLSFDVSSLLRDTPILRAVLYLYTPTQTTATGVQVYADAAPSATSASAQPTSWQPANWNSAPPLVAGSLGIGQSGSDGHWQRWDVTGWVRRWVQDGRSNAGLTLAGANRPTLFASPLAAGSGTPATAPYLDIIYGARPALEPAFYDPGANTVFGISGTFGNCTTTGTICSNQTDNALALDQEQRLGGKYARFTVVLSCSSSSPGSSYWNSNTSDPFNVGSSYQLLSKAYADQIIPIVTFAPNNEDKKNDGICNNGMVQDNTTWFLEIANFIDNMPKPPVGRAIYFEIGNEENANASFYVHPDYPTIFNGGATALCYHLNLLLTGQSRCATIANYTIRILTGGMLQPTSDRASCQYPTGNTNIVEAENAIAKAENTGLVPVAMLGVGVHPYKYNTPANQGYWKNYYGPSSGGAGRYGNNTYAGICGDLASMLSLWTSDASLPAVVVFTEDNWSPDPTHEGNCPVGPNGDLTPIIGCEGTYLVDLITWLGDHRPFTDPLSSPIRVAWFRGADGSPPLYLGLYTYTGGQKDFITDVCPADSSVAGNHHMADDYQNLIQGLVCY